VRARRARLPKPPAGTPAAFSLSARSDVVARGDSDRRFELSSRPERAPIEAGFDASECVLAGAVDAVSCAQDAPRMAHIAVWSSRKSAQSGLCSAKKPRSGKIPESIRLSFRGCRRCVARSTLRSGAQRPCARSLANKTTLKTTFRFELADAVADRAR